jgi:hypothetical protein
VPLLFGACAVTGFLEVRAAGLLQSRPRLRLTLRDQRDYRKIETDNPMNKTNLLLTLGAALLLAPATPSPAQSTWETVADFQSVAFTAVDALAKDADGNLYASFATADTKGRRHAVIRKSTDHGASWPVVEDFVSAPHCDLIYLRLGTDAAGHLYAVGYATDDRGQTRWIVRKSGDGGRSWSTVDDFARPGAQTTAAEGFAADASGNLYVAGHADEPHSVGPTDWHKHWLVRQSRDGGGTWSTIDDFTDNFSARAMAILSTPSGLFVAGSGWNGKSQSGERWLVRKATDDGTGSLRWQTVDEFQMQEHGLGIVSRAQGLGVDARGNLYAVGRSYAVVDGCPSAHWVVRRASRSGSDWEVVDTFQLEPGRFATACGVAASDQGGVLVVGRATGDDAALHWIVRKSTTGEVGTWSVSDALPAVAQTQPDAAAKTVGEVTILADGSMQSAPPRYACGLAILCDSRRVLTGGLNVAGVGHATVRSLDLGTTSEFAATKISAAR